MRNRRGEADLGAQRDEIMKDRASKHGAGADSPGTSIDESERRTKIPALRGVAEPSCCCCCCETHDAHTLRTPKHEGLYRYGRRCSLPAAAAFQHNALL